MLKIAPQKVLLEKIIKNGQGQQKVPDIFKDNRGLKIAPEDIESFSRHLEDAFESIAGRYYLSLSKMPKVSVTKNSIHVRLTSIKTSKVWVVFLWLM